MNMLEPQSNIFGLLFPSLSKRRIEVALHQMLDVPLGFSVANNIYSSKLSIFVHEGILLEAQEFCELGSRGSRDFGNDDNFSTNCISLFLFDFQQRITSGDHNYLRFNL